VDEMAIQISPGTGLKTGGRPTGGNVFMRPNLAPINTRLYWPGGINGIFFTHAVFDPTYQLPSHPLVAKAVNELGSADEVSVMG